MAGVRAGRSAETFVYPDLLGWSPPRTALDSVIGEAQTLMLAGLGPLDPEADSSETGGKSPSILRWCTLPFGQRVLVKMRHSPQNISPDQRPTGYVLQPPHVAASPERAGAQTPARQQQPAIPPESTGIRRTTHTLDALTQAAIDSRFDPKVVGEGLLQAATGAHAMEHAVAFAAVIAKARVARARRDERSRAATGRQQSEMFSGDDHNREK